VTTDTIKQASRLIIFFCFLLVAAATSAEEQTTIASDRLEYISATDTYIATGSVNLVFGDKTLAADELRLDNNTSESVASGHVVYEDPEAILQADRIELNFGNKLGTAYNSSIFYKEHNFHLHGKNIKKTGDRSFYLDKATVTTCDAEPPPWHIAGKDIKATQHKSLSARHARLYAGNLPVLYTPYFWAPISRKRQTGFLFPSLGYSSTRGSYYKQGFFWAIKENQDVTLYLDYYSEKKLAEGLDYRYILTPDINGEFWLYRARDDEPSRDLIEVKSYHSLKLPHNVSASLKAHAVNEFDYYERLDATSSGRMGLASGGTDPFGFASEERLQKYLESDLHVSRPFNAGRTYLLAQARQSLEGSSAEVPQSLPEIGFIINTFSRGPYSFNAAFKGVNFWRKDGQKGSRLDINPNFYLSLGRLVNFTQRVGFRETAYFLDEPAAHENRLLFDLSTTLTTRLSRQYASFIHIIEPSVEYEHIPSVNQDNIPFFDSVDFIPQTSNINFSVTNRISGWTRLNLESRFRFSQSYSLLDIAKPFSPLLAEAALTSDKVDFYANASYDVHDRLVAETITSVLFKNKKGYIGIGENYRRSSSLDQVTFEAGLYSPISVNGNHIPVDMHSKLWYDLKGNGVQEINIRSAYTHQCWGFSVSYTRRPDEYQVAFAVELKGLGTLRVGTL